MIYLTLLASSGVAVLSSEVDESHIPRLQELGIASDLADGTRKIVSEVSGRYDSAYAALDKDNEPVLQRFLRDATEVMAANQTARYIINVY